MKKTYREMRVFCSYISAYALLLMFYTFHNKPKNPVSTCHISINNVPICLAFIILHNVSAITILGSIPVCKGMLQNLNLRNQFM